MRTVPPLAQLLKAVGSDLLFHHSHGSVREDRIAEPSNMVCAWHAAVLVSVAEPVIHAIVLFAGYGVVACCNRFTEPCD